MCVWGFHCEDLEKENWKKDVSGFEPGTSYTAGNTYNHYTISLSVITLSYWKLCIIVRLFHPSRIFTAEKRWYTPLKLCIFHLSQIFTWKQRWYMGVKTKLSKIEGVFFSLPAPVYEVTLFLYLLRPWRTGGKKHVIVIVYGIDNVEHFVVVESSLLSEIL